MFAEVVINRKIPAKFDTFTYKIPEEIKVKTGHTVWVPFRNKKIAGVISDLVEREPQYKVRDIFGPIIENPLFSQKQLELAKFMSKYYFCPISKILPMFLPKKIWNNKFLKSAPPAKLNKKIVQQKLTLDAAKLTPSIANLKLLGLEKLNKKNLLHCVKTKRRLEIYSELIEKFSQKKSQILIIVPEIIFIPQFLEYFQRYIETPITIFHSELKESEKNAVWMSVYKNEAKIILGSKKALFLPFQNLDLVIVENEESPSYKEKKAPHYNVKKIAEKIAEFNNAILILGSSAPSIDTYCKIKNNEYRLLEISDKNLAEFLIIDMRDERKKGNFGFLSEKLKEAIAKTLASHQRIVLFINRKGLGGAIFCKDCGYIEKCPVCKNNLSLNLHNIALCRNCGFKKEAQVLCPLCKSTKFFAVGLGTQKVEEKIKKLFSLAKIARIDKDTISSKSSMKASIIIGTQMIINMPIKNVGLVGIIQLDAIMNIPDFKANEGVFRLLTQFQNYFDSKGKILVQTYNKENQVLEAVSNNDYKSFYENEIKIREENFYPPFSEIIKLSKIKDAENIYKKIEAASQGSGIKVLLSSAMEIFMRGKNPEKLIRELQLDKENICIERI